jgi:thiamine-phosphate pyrophosphorylase
MKSFLLCYITDRRQLRSASLPAAIGDTLGAGVDMVQIREKDLATRELIALVEEALKAANELERGFVARASGLPPISEGRPFAPLRRSRKPQNRPAAQSLRAAGQGSALSERAHVLVNDRLDVALAAGADGVHLGGHSMPVQVVRRVAPRPFVLGVSCHSLGEAQAAESGGADYLVLGPIFETPSKLGYGPPLGLEKLRIVTSRIRIPVLALGGITVERVRPCLEAGASGIAGIRIFQDCESVQERVRELRAQGG